MFIECCITFVPFLNPLLYSFDFAHPYKSFGNRSVINRTFLMVFIGVSFAVFRLRVWPKWRQGSGTCSPYLCPSTLSIFDFVAGAVMLNFFWSRLYFSAPKINTIITIEFSEVYSNYLYPVHFNCFSAIVWRFWDGRRSKLIIVLISCLCNVGKSVKRMEYNNNKPFIWTWQRRKKLSYHTIAPQSVTENESHRNPS